MVTLLKTNDDHFFALPVDPRLEARAMLFDGFSRLLIWMANAATLEERGLRASVALYSTASDPISSARLTRSKPSGEFAGETFQAVHKLAEEFRLTTGLESCITLRFLDSGAK